ncbi:hypothetical protein OQA88_919 [Cercophora sp. LCS_1]
MALGGLVLGTVAHIPRHPVGQRLKRWRELCRDGKTDSLQVLPTPYGTSPEIREEEFRRLLCLGTGDEGGGPDIYTMNPHGGSFDDPVIRELEMVASPVLVQGKMFVAKLTKDWLADAGRQFFITDYGLYGAGPDSVAEGDVVIIPFGGKMPLLLRQCDVEPRTNYYLVEESYVHGVVKGELFQGGESGGGFAFSVFSVF